MILLLETSDTQNQSCALPCSNFICHGAVDGFNFAGFKCSSFKVRHLPRGPQIVRQSDLFSCFLYVDEFPLCFQNPAQSISISKIIVMTKFIPWFMEKFIPCFGTKAVLLPSLQ
jgi:hypothetical protein